jgi:AraC-like DNA-binding protein
LNYEALVRQSLDFIENNLRGRICLEDLAKNVYLSKYHFHRVFHGVTGESVSKFIHKRRMEEAARELMVTEKPIIDIALSYQFGSPEAFSRAFRRVHGIAPGEYRRQYAVRQIQRHSVGSGIRAAA